MKTIKLNLALGIAFLLSVPMSLAAMNQNLKDEVNEWISTYVLAQDVDPEDYWGTLKKLGETIDRETAEALASLDSYAIEEAVAFMAYEVAQNPERVETLTAWYGRPMYQVTRETYEKAGWVFDDERWDAHQQRRDNRRDKFNPERLRPEHQTDEYRTAWQAWLLSPRLRGSVHERHIMFRNIRVALLNLPDPANIPISILATEQLQFINDPTINDSKLKRIKDSESTVHAGFVSNVLTKDGVLGLLKLNRFAVERGYADAHVDFDDVGRGGPKYHFTRSIERTLASRSFYTIDEIYEDPKKWSGAETGIGRYIADDRWKTFKPIIEELLADPQAYDLQEIDIELLQNALRLMPDAPFPGKDK